MTSKLELYTGKSITDTRPKRNDISFSDFVRTHDREELKPSGITYKDYSNLQTSAKVEVKQGDYFLACSLIPGGKRCSADLMKVQLLSLDLDWYPGVSSMKQDAFKVLNGAGVNEESREKLSQWNWWMYTTFSSTATEPRMRLVIEADGIMDPSEYAVAVATIGDLLGLHLNSESLTPAQLMFFPNKAPDDTAGAYLHDSNLEGRAFTRADIDQDAARNWLSEKGQNAGKAFAGTHGHDPLEIFRPPREDFSIEDAETLLGHIDPTDPKDSGGGDRRLPWLQVGMALHHQFDGDPAALEVWETWSQGGDNYEEGVTGIEWDCFRGTESMLGSGKTPQTINYLFWLARQGGWGGTTATEAKAFDDVVSDMGRATTPDAIMAILKGAGSYIKEDWHPDILLEAAKKLKTGIRISVMRKVLMSAVRAEREKVDGVEKGALAGFPEELQGWVHIGAGNTYWKEGMPETVSEKTLNTRHAFALTQWDEKERRLVSRFIADEGLHRATADCPAYMPGEEVLFESDLDVFQDPRRFFNVWRDTGAPYVKGRVSKGDPEAVAMFERHIHFLFEDANTILDFLAYTVQNPTDRIRWMAVLQSTEGAGKGYIKSVMMAVLGPTNVGAPNASVLEDKFNEWAYRNKLIVFEELKLPHSSREAIVNRLKPFITDDAVSVRLMRTDPFMVPNVVNYMAFTNYKTAMAVSEHDRRFFLSFSRFQTKEGLEAAIVDQMGISPEIYYNRLFSSIESNASGLRAYLEERELSPLFTPNKAPHSRSKDAAIRTSMGDAELWVSEAMALDLPYVNNIFCSATILNKIRTAGKSRDDFTSFGVIAERIEANPPNSLSHIYSLLEEKFRMRRLGPALSLRNPGGDNDHGRTLTHVVYTNSDYQIPKQIVALKRSLSEKYRKAIYDWERGLDLMK